VSTWVERSFALVDEGGYLDRMAEIYPPALPGGRQIAQARLDMVRVALEEPDDRVLLRTVLQFRRFPFNHPYVSFLRQSPQEILRNPVVVGVICRRLRDMGVEGVLDGLQKPKELNRQMGPMFSTWLQRQYPFSPNPDLFQASLEAVVFLGGSGEMLRRFANNIGCGIKQPDFLARVGGRYVVGEAKWVGTGGGNQDRGFEDALRLASASFPRAVTVAVLDGIVWVRGRGGQSRRLANFSGNALSALLLADFLESL